MKLSRVMAGSRGVAMLTALVVVIGGAALSTASSAGAGVPPEAGSFAALSPARVLDSRTGNGAARQAVAAGHMIAVQIAGRGGVPASGVSAVTLNVVVTGATGAQGVTVYPDGGARPGLVSFNYAPGQSAANLVTSRLGANGKVDLAVSGTGTVQLLADVTGYYLGGTPTAAGSFTALSPSRVLDTRVGNGAARQAVAAGHTIVLQVSGRGGVPASGVSAVALDVVAVSATGAQGVTVYPNGAARPGLVSFNDGTGPSTAHLVVSRIGADGKVDLYVSGTGAVQLLADVTGYYRAGTPTAVGSFTALSPARILDTRTGNGAAAQAVAGDTVAVQITGRGGVPATGVSAVALNVVEIGATGAQGVTVYPDGGIHPGLVSMNYRAGSSTAHLVMSKVGADGKVDLTVSGTGTVQLLADVIGYDQAPPLPSLSRSAPVDVEPFHGGLRGLSCVSSSFCVAIDNAGNALTYDGTNWSDPVDLDSHAQLTGVSCVSTSFCVAVEYGGKALTFDGTRWSSPVTIDPFGSAAVSCVSTSYCMAVNGGGSAATYDGASWTTMGTGLPAGQVSISCASPSYCRGAAGTTSSFWDGARWTVEQSRASGTSCVSSTFCVAVDDQGNVDVFSGPSRVSHTNVDAVGLTSVSCPTTSFCVAVDLTGNALTFDGTTWSSPVDVDGSLRGLRRVSCASPSFCAVIASGGRALTFDGVTWTAPILIDSSSSQVSAVSCATQSFCMAVDNAGTAISFDGSAWSTPASIDSAGLSAVSCVSISFCKAVDRSGRVLTYTGGSWSAPEAISAEQLVAISCASTAFCVAFDASGAAESFDGARWTTTPQVDQPNSLIHVSCAAATFCLAVNFNGAFFTFDGVRWSAPSTVEPGTRFESVSCASAWFCAATAINGQGFVYDAAGWSPAFSMGADGTVSCNSPSFCVSVDSYGRAQTYNGTTWSAPVAFATPGVNAVSCAAEKLCMAVTGAAVATAGSA